MMSMLFLRISFRQNFHFFMVCYFLEMFGKELKRRYTGIVSHYPFTEFSFLAYQKVYAG